MGSTLEFLRGQLEEATASLPGVVQRRAFGNFGFFFAVPGSTRPEMFALASREDERIGVKLTDRNDYDTLMSWPGTRIWTVQDDRPMSNWLLVPESFHDDVDVLKVWVKKAHAQASVAAKAKPKAMKRR